MGGCPQVNQTLRIYHVQVSGKALRQSSQLRIHGGVSGACAPSQNIMQNMRGEANFWGEGRQFPHQILTSVQKPQKVKNLCTRETKGEVPRSGTQEMQSRGGRQTNRNNPGKAASEKYPNGVQKSRVRVGGRDSFQRGCPQDVLPTPQFWDPSLQ